MSDRAPLPYDFMPQVPSFAVDERRRRPRSADGR